MAINQTSSQNMLKFTISALANQFADQYEFEFGKKKVIEIVRKTEDSILVSQYLQEIIDKGCTPKANDLEILLNSIKYFMFSKEETICLGGLICLVRWVNKFFFFNNLNIIEQQEFEHKITPIGIELINNCKSKKFNKGNNFFLRFETKINHLIKNEPKRGENWDDLEGI